MKQLRSYIIVVFLLAIGYVPLTAQEQMPPERPDSVLVAPDIVNDLIIGSDSIIDIQEIIFVDDSLVIATDTLRDITIDSPLSIEITSFKPNPKKAVIYSAIFPGLGQIYNRKYWKLPIIYGGFVGVSYAITWNNSHYTDYMDAYRSILRNDPEDTAWHNLLPYGRDPESIDKKWFTGVLKDRSNYFRYYRDLSIIIGVALYGLGIVDAYVDAQLFEFDISPDLSMRIEPAIIERNNFNNFMAQGYGLKWSMSF